MEVYLDEFGDYYTCCNRRLLAIHRYVARSQLDEGTFQVFADVRTGSKASKLHKRHFTTENGGTSIHVRYGRGSHVSKRFQ